MPLKFFYSIWNKYKTFKKKFILWTWVNFVSRGFSKTKTNFVGFSDSSGQRFRLIAISFQLAHVSCHLLEAGVLCMRGKNERRFIEGLMKEGLFCNQKEKPMNRSNIFKLHIFRLLSSREALSLIVWIESYDEKKYKFWWKAIISLYWRGR